MYVDPYFLLVIYILAASAALISVYALWVLKEIEETLKKKGPKPTNAWDHYHNTQTKTKTRPKGYWG